MTVEIQTDGNLNPGTANLGGSHSHQLNWHNKSTQYPAVVHPPDKQEWAKIFIEPFPGQIQLAPNQTSPTFSLKVEPRPTGEYPYSSLLNGVKGSGNIEVHH